MGEKNKDNSVRTFGDVGAGAQQIDDVEVRAEVDENLEFGDETGQSGQIGVGSDHFDGHRLDDGLFHYSVRFGFQHSAKAARSQLFTCLLVKIQIK